MYCSGVKQFGPRNSIHCNQQSGRVGNRNGGGGGGGGCMDFPSYPLPHTSHFQLTLQRESTMMATISVSGSNPIASSNLSDMSNHNS